MRGSIFRHRRVVPSSWQEELERVVPRTDRVNWLKLVWQPGMDYEPVQRWEIYEMTPRLEFIEPQILEALHSKSPREDGVWYTHQQTGTRRWLSNSIVSLAQWELFRETNCYPARWWIIQGQKGGHKWKLSQAERNFLAAYGLKNADTPLPGNRPYAEWDNRVLEQILRHDKLRKYTQKYAKGWEDRFHDKTTAGLWVKVDRDAEQQKFATEMLRWLCDQVDQVVSDIPRTFLSSLADAPRGDPYYNKDEDALDQELIEGRTPIIGAR